MRAHETRTDRERQVGWRVLTLLLSLVLVGAPRALAQQVLEVDYDTERVGIDDPYHRSLAFGMLAIDHARGILYVEDREEPEGVMSFFLLTGERLNVVRYAKGGGPNELPQNKAGFALAPGGNLFVADPSKVLELDPLGEVVSYWLPRAPMRLVGETVRADNLDERLQPSLDENGNLVLVSTRGIRLSLTGVIIDLESGCHALLRHRPQPGSRVVATYADSAVVFHRETVPTERGVSIGANAGRVTLNPLRRVSGEPCADMVPSVTGRG